MASKLAFNPQQQANQAAAAQLLLAEVVAVRTAVAANPRKK